ncbi:MAG: ATPase [Tannerellaceae bacterium]|jgi:N-acetylglucosamine kinase-like BadF-type ATPase|nr:ATPase [Tannerellaceae bacterium]
MILIADSGSTKTEWCVADKGVPAQKVLTAGMNPYFQSPEEIKRDIELSLLPAVKDLDIEAVCFYGAGCASPEKKRIIFDVLSSLLLVPIEVHSDLTGAARALCGRQAGIACVLGTGSNSCLYDGESIVRNIAPLGYILGDEGSGAVLGRLLAGDCLKNQLPGHLVDKFMTQYRLTPSEILERVYRQPFPNRFLATLSRFLIENIHEPAIHDLVYHSFRSFFIRNVMQYDGFRDYPVYFTGSIAFYYRQVLREAARSVSLDIQRIEPAPMPGLLAYHS